jgi:hypothetical protein
MYKSRSVLVALAAVIGSVAAVLLVSVPPRAALADDRCPPHGSSIVPLNRSVDHRSYAEWTAAWWQWASSYAPDVNPVLDPNGQFAGQGQSGPVWFLAGTFGTTAVRDITIPSDKYLLLPLANSEWDTVPGFTNPLGLPDPLSVEDCRAITDYYVHDTSVTCSIDGHPVQRPHSYRVRSTVFSMNFDSDFMAWAGYPAPYVRTAVSDGYWLILYPLDTGSHVIHFTASNPGTGFSLDVTYNITVTP